MTSRRAEKMAHAILETVSTTILFHLKDPRVKNVTVLNVEVAGDMRSAKVYVSVMGDDKAQALCMHGLRSARGFIQSKLGNRLDTRYIPVLTFVLDQSVKKSAEASRILREVLPPDQNRLDYDEPGASGEQEDDAVDDDKRYAVTDDFDADQTPSTKGARNETRASSASDSREASEPSNPERSGSSHRSDSTP